MPRTSGRLVGLFALFALVGTGAHGKRPARVATKASPAWVRVLFQLNAGMRPRPGKKNRPTSLAQAERIVKAAGGAIDCSKITWISSESGVLDGACEGTIPFGRGTTPIILEFRKFEIPSASGKPGLLSVRVEGPFLGDKAAPAWHVAAHKALVVRLGKPVGKHADQRWRKPGRFILLHNAENAPCGGLCRTFVWVGGVDHPQLKPRGFR